MTWTLKLGNDAGHLLGALIGSNAQIVMRDTSNLVSDVLWVVLGAPIISFVWLLLSRGWTNLLGTSQDDAVKGWTNSGFWIVLWLSFSVGIAMLLYVYLVKSR